MNHLICVLHIIFVFTTSVHSENKLGTSRLGMFSGATNSNPKPKSKPQGLSSQLSGIEPRPYTDNAAQGGSTQGANGDDAETRKTQLDGTSSSAASPGQNSRKMSWIINDGTLPQSTQATSPKPSSAEAWSTLQKPLPAEAAEDNPNPSELPKPTNVETVTGDKVYNQGRNYEVEFKKEGTGAQCAQKFTVRGKNGMPTGDISDTFQTSCDDKSSRTIYYTDSTAMVGGIDQDILVYGHKSVPNNLVVLKDGKTLVKTYTKSGVDTKELAKEDADKVKELMNGLQVEYILPSSQRQPDVIQDILNKLEGMLKTMTVGQDGTPTGQSTKPTKPSGGGGSSEGLFGSLDSLKGVFCCC